MVKQQSAFELLLQATQTDRALRQFTQNAIREHSEMTVTEWLLLSIIQRGPQEGMSMSALSSTLGVSRPQISALIEGLLGRRLIRQRKAQQDGRSRVAVVTERGKDTLKIVNKAVEQAMRSLVQTIPGTHLQIYQQVQAELIRRNY